MVDSLMEQDRIFAEIDEACNPCGVKALAELGHCNRKWDSKNSQMFVWKVDAKEPQQTQKCIP